MTTKSSYLLKFQLNTSDDSDLIVGILQLLKDGKVINAYQATSSLPGRQQDGSWAHTGGLIPPTDGNYLPKPGELYQVNLMPVRLPNVPGVNDGSTSNFYPISPSDVCVDGTDRGDWGIHFDGNVPGSMGCVVLETRRGWSALQRDFTTIKQEGFESIPLDVIYA